MNALITLPNYPITPDRPMRFSFTFLGHSTFLFQTTSGKRVIVDPWLETNPACPASHKRVRALDLMLLTHGHRDHIADAVPLVRPARRPSRRTSSRRGSKRKD